MKIISVVPSITELLFDLGLDNQVIGITKFCVHPEVWFRNKTRIGGTKTLDIEKILSLEPDLVIANKEENVKEQIEALQQHTEVYVSDIKSPHDNLTLIQDLGKLTDTRMSAIRLEQELKTAIDSIIRLESPMTCTYVIWQKPYMTVGNDTYIHSMMALCGLANSFADKTRYPEFAIEELQKDSPDVILLSSEPFPFKDSHKEFFQSQFPNSAISLADGETFSWYGSRLIKKIDYLNNLMKELSAPLV